MKIKPQRIKRASIHRALSLQSTYTIRASVSGYIGKDHYELREMASSTGGCMIACAMSRHFGEWEEISRRAFTRYALAIIAHI